jgi:hypothetical protein
MELADPAPNAVPTPKDLIGRWVDTPCEVFFRRGTRVYRGKITKEETKRNKGIPAVECVYLDGDVCWYPVESVLHWLIPEANVNLEDEAYLVEPMSEPEEDSEEEEEEEGEGEEGEEEEGDAAAAQVAKKHKGKQPKVPLSPEDAEALKTQAAFTDSLHAKVKAGLEQSAAHTPTSPAFEGPPPGLSEDFKNGKPANAKLGIWYCFLHILTLKFWDDLSTTSLAYAEFHKAGTDVNVEKAPTRRFVSYKGKGKARKFNTNLLSPKNLMKFHATWLIMLFNTREALTDHFSLEPLLRSPVSTYYGVVAWQQTMRFFSAYDPAKLVTDRKSAAYDPYFKYRSIQDMMQENVNKDFTPPQELSYDEGGKPWTGKGGEGIAVHFNPLKPNKRMSMCYIVAAWGIPLSWEFYTGAVSNTYNERRYNTPEERACKITIARIIRLTRRFHGRWHHLYCDNAFVSVLLFYMLWFKYKMGACGTARKNKVYTVFAWVATAIRGKGPSLLTKGFSFVNYIQTS